MNSSINIMGKVREPSYALPVYFTVTMHHPRPSTSLVQVSYFLYVPYHYRIICANTNATARTVRDNRKWGILCKTGYSNCTANGTDGG
jgi:hypothetical protein